MEINAPWITCRAGKKRCLLAKDEKAYYIIEVDKKLDHAAEEWLEQQGVSEMLLKELKLPFEYIPKSALRGVAVSGCEAGEWVYLYLKSEKKKLRLELDYDPVWMDEFFHGIERFTPPAEKPAKKKKDRSWRRKKRDQKLYNQLWWVPIALGALSLVTSFAYSRFKNVLWLLLWISVLVVPLTLVILMPGYFTLIPEQKGKKRDARGLDFPILIHMAAGMVLHCSNWLDDSIFFTVLGICGVISCGVCLLAEEFRREPVYLIVVALLGGIFGMGIVAEVNEVFPHEPPQVHVLDVEDTYRTSSRRSRSYYCTVTLPDGREENLEISRSLYEELEIGDYVQVEYGVGFFGIEYANAYRVEE